LIKTEYFSAAGQSIERWEYIGDLVLRNGVLFQVAVPDGRAVFANGSWNYELHYTDHLGNVRATINRQGQLISSSHFDPWGHRLQGLGTTATQLTNRWELQGKERDLTFGLNRINFGARVYNPTIGVWDQVDPLGDERVWVSPYNFNQNNPINRIDPTGALDEPCCGDPGGMLLSEAKSQWAAAKSYGRSLLQKVEGGFTTVLSYTDVNDVTVLVTTATRGGNAINIDGSKATTADKWAAAGGVILPGVSGSAAKKLVGEVVDKIDDVIDAVKGGNSVKSSSRAGKAFTPAEKAKVLDANAAKNEGKIVCEGCGVSTTKPAKSERGVTPPKTDRQIDHIVPKSKGGSGTADNGQVLCRDCNRQKSNN